MPANPAVTDLYYCSQDVAGQPPVKEREHYTISAFKSIHAVGDFAVAMTDIATSRGLAKVCVVDIQAK
jgi:hypothetical protein